MAKQTINVGAAPNDGTGDPHRTAFQKANANFTELYDAVDARLEAAANLADLADVATARDNLDVPSNQEVTDAIASAGGGGGGGGATTLDGLTDVDTTTVAPSDGQALIYDAADSTWKPDDLPSGGGGGSVAVEDEGAEVVSAATRFNFTGAGVTATDLGDGQVEISIPGAGGGAIVPAIIQSKAVALSNLSTGITLDAPPTEGSVLVAIVFNTVASSQPFAISGWSSAFSDSSDPQVMVAWRVVGAGETALQNPTYSTNGGIIVLYEITGAVAVVSRPSSRATSTTVSVSFNTDSQYLPTSSGIGIVFGGRRSSQGGSFSGSFATDLVLTDSGAVVGGTGLSVTTGTAVVPRNSALTATCSWSTSFLSRAGFVLVA